MNKKLEARVVCACASVALLGSTPALAQHTMNHDMVMPDPTPAPDARPNTAPAPMPSPAARAAHQDKMAMPPMTADQTSVDHSPTSPSMDHASMDHEMVMPANFAEGSGTTRLPANEPMNHGLHLKVGEGDSLMLHGYVWGIYTNQSGSRGGDKLYAQSMAMAQYKHPFAGGRLQLRAMGSLEPAMRHDGYGLERRA